MAHRAKHRRDALIRRWLRVENGCAANGNLPRERRELGFAALPVSDFLREGAVDDDEDSA